MTQRKPIKRDSSNISERPNRVAQHIRSDGNVLDSISDDKPQRHARHFRTNNEWAERETSREAQHFRLDDSELETEIKASSNKKNRQRVYVSGELIRLRSLKSYSKFRAFAPDGLIVIIPSSRGYIDLWVPQVGEWTYEWGDFQDNVWLGSGQTGKLLVSDSSMTDELPETIQLPSMTVSRQLRF
jgi:hypothetical protein